MSQPRLFLSFLLFIAEHFHDTSKVILVSIF